MNIMGTPLGMPASIEEYIQSKLQKHKLMMAFIMDVAKMGFSRETHKMITGSAVPRLIHIIKSIPKNATPAEWMQFADHVHLSTWLSCVGAEELVSALPATERAHLAASLNLPPQFGGVGMQSLIRAADEELLG
jgi:hypothetical protein